MAPAKIHLEPYASAGVSYSKKLSRSSPLFMNYAGGARAGFSFLLVKAGLDLSYNYYSGESLGFPNVVINQPPQSRGFSQADDSASITYSKAGKAFKPFNIGVFGAFDLPLLFDLYASLFYSAGGKQGALSYPGWGMKAGLSYLSIPWISLNLEALWANYSNSQVKYLRQFSIMSVQLSVSLPLSFKGGGSSQSSPAPAEPAETDLEDF